MAERDDTSAAAGSTSEAAMSTWKLLALLAVAGALAAGFGWWVGTAFNRPAPLPVPAHVEVAGTGAPLPELALANLGGGVESLTDLRGRPLIINFWATWCPPCIAEMPMLSAFHSAQAPDGPQVVGIALDNPERVRAFLAKTPVEYRILLDEPDEDDASVILGNIRGVLPFAVLVGSDGRILATHEGEFSRAELERWLSRHDVPFVGE